MYPLEAKTEGYDGDVACYLILVDIATKVVFSILSIYIVECLMLCIVCSAILVCDIEVYHLVELDAQACGDILLLRWYIVCEDRILEALTEC